jgi:tRNA(fMet)-specific endonuclease VapC
VIRYLLDTNACIALINGDPVSVRKKFDRARAAGDQIFVPSIAVFELWYGVFKSARVEFNTNRVETFLAGSSTQLAYEEEDARTAGIVRADLEAGGKPIGVYDVLLAGQAMSRQLTLVTANVSEFSRVKGLLWQDWARA